MNTRPFPALTALLAGGIVCIFSFVQHVDMVIFARRFIITVILFWIIGLVVKFIVDKNFNTPENLLEEEEDDGESEE